MQYVQAFICCGTICLIGQILYDHTKFTAGHITSLFVVLGTFLDFFHVYDKIIAWGGAGAYLPITSFGHSLMHATMSQIETHGLIGIPQGMFTLTAAGITSGIYFAFIVAIIFKPKS